MKFDSIKPEGVYYTVTRHKMGNTTMRTVSIHTVSVLAIDAEKRTVLACWNGNPARIYSERDFSKWRLNKPITVGTMPSRLATREELAAMKAAKADT
jgi:hypothetical protein